MMKVVEAIPPMYGEINRKFRIRGKPVIFTWGDTIYNPTRMAIPPQLFVHEQVHCDRQGGYPEDWWREYLRDKDFRLAEEIDAHIAEYGFLCLQEPNMHRHQIILHGIADRLASPIYGGMIDYWGARERLTDALLRLHAAP